MLILGVEPNLTAYKTVVRTDTLYELSITGFTLKNNYFLNCYMKPPHKPRFILSTIPGLEPGTS